jgi:hypothetical protein
MTKTGALPSLKTSHNCSMIPAVRRLRQEDHRYHGFKASLSHTVRNPVLKKREKEKHQKPYHSMFKGWPAKNLQS